MTAYTCKAPPYLSDIRCCAIRKLAGLAVEEDLHDRARLCYRLPIHRGRLGAQRGWCGNVYVYRFQGLTL